MREIEKVNDVEIYQNIGDGGILPRQVQRRMSATKKKKKRAITK